MKIPALLPLLFSLMLLSSCEVLDQVQQMQAFSQCDFQLQSIQNTQLAGVSIHEMDNWSDVNLFEAAKITQALASNKLWLDFDLNVLVSNPNSQTAAMNKLDWILLIDNVEMINGTMAQRTTIPANGGTAIIPLHMHMDLYQILSGKSAESILNFGFNLAGMGNQPSRVTLKAKPSIQVANRPVSYPGYITVNNDIGK